MRARGRAWAAGVGFTVAVLAGCGGGVAVVGGDAPQAVAARDAAVADLPALDVVVAPADAPSPDVPTSERVPLDDRAEVARDRAEPADVDPPIDALEADVLALDVLVTRPDRLAVTDVVTLDDLPPPDAGGCGLSCATGQECCDGRCVDTALDPLHCGRCGARCDATRQCVQGACLPNCASPLSRCGGQCVDTRSSASHCGGCGMQCPTGQACAAGVCTIVCPAGLVNCNGACVELATSESNCGGCGMLCAPRVTCFQGSCYTQCGQTTPTYCPGPNYCTDTLTDEDNCGGCGARCAAGQECSNGACGCPPGAIECGGQCVPATCTRGTGACAASGPQRCVNGVATCDAVPGAAGTEVCNNRDDDCDGMTDESLTQPCFPGPGMPGVGLCSAGSQTCANGVWGTCGAAVTAVAEVCDGRDQNCNGIVDDGIADVPCYTFTAGAPGVGRCAQGVRRCVAGALAACAGEVGPLPEVCNLLDDDCDGAPDDGVDLSLCPGRPNAIPMACVSGACQYVCASGRASCDGNPTNGCEVDTRTSLQHCGGCNNPCAAGQFCNNGACQANCTAGAVCNGQCVDTTTSLQHCGACGNGCAAPAGGTVTCMGGTCVGGCPTGFTNCNGACFDLASDPAHCGSCTSSCRPGQACVSQTGSPSCMCPTGQLDCGGQCVTPQSDPANCGACGVVCPAGSSCNAGACRCGGTGPTPCGGTCAGLGNACIEGVGACRVQGVFACLAGAVRCNAIPRSPTTELCNSVDDDCDGVVDNSNAEDTCAPSPFRTATCAGGACAYACYAGRGDCDGVASNGCETDLLVTPAHCGTCGRPCANGACALGTCAPCAAGETVCSNRCVSLRGDAANCGMCGLRCATGEFCDQGSCRAASTGVDGGVLDGGALDGGSDGTLGDAGTSADVRDAGNGGP